MNETEKFEFCSRDWVGVAHDHLQNAAKDVDLSGISYSLNEILTDAPAHLAIDSSGRTSWHYRIDAGRVSAAVGFLDDATIRVTTDYEAMLPLARMVMADNPEGAAEAEKLIERLTAEGKFKQEMNGDAVPDLLPDLQWAAQLHDVLARHTR